MDSVGLVTSKKYESAVTPCAGVNIVRKLLMVGHVVE